MSFTIVVLLAVAIGVAIAVVRIRQDKDAGVIATFGSLRLTPTELIEGYGPSAKRHPVAGLSARVEDSGTLNRRITATRMVALGVFALAAPKKQDDRSVYLTIEGPATAIVYTVEMKQHYNAGDGARKFAATVNMHGRQAPVAQAPVHPSAIGPALPMGTPPQAWAGYCSTVHSYGSRLVSRRARCCPLVRRVCLDSSDPAGAPASSSSRIAAYGRGADDVPVQRSKQPAESPDGTVLTLHVRR